MYEHPLLMMITIAVGIVITILGIKDFFDESCRVDGPKHLYRYYGKVACAFEIDFSDHHMSDLWICQKCEKKHYGPAEYFF